VTTLREFDRLDREWKRLHIRFVQIGSVSGSETLVHHQRRA
jgi:hypothetical protein